MNPQSIYVDTALKDRITDFLKKEAIQLNMSTDKACQVHILTSNEQQACNLTRLYEKGYIICPVALTLAQKLNLPSKQLGKLLNHLTIKIKECGLGCF